VLAGAGSLRASAVTWMTPATFPNLLAVFYYWLPFGRIGGPGRLLLDLLGAASLLLPLGAGLALARRKRGAPDPALALAAAAGLAMALGFVLLLWLLQRCGLMTVFYAPRYPALAAGLWAAGLAALALWTSQRAGLPRTAAGLLLAPWLLAAIAGQVWAVIAERRGGLQEMRARFAPYLPPPGESLYVLPSELLPYFRQTFADFRLRPIGAMPCELAGPSGHGAATVLDLNFWHLLDRPRDLIARTVLETGALAAAREAAAFPDQRRDYAVYRLLGIDPAAAEALCRRGLSPAPRPIPPAAAAVALPENQEYHRGWSFPEVAPDRTIRRWANRETAEILFDRALPPGAYLVHLHGYNPAYPSAPAKIAVGLPGARPELRTVPEGELTLDLPLGFPLDLKKRQAPLRLSVTRATWSPRKATGARDTRVLSFLFEYAWVERRASSRPEAK
jgi:hypothetical protein